MQTAVYYNVTGKDTSGDYEAYCPVGYDPV